MNKPKHSFGGTTLDTIMSLSMPAPSGAQELPVDTIEEDPGQPRLTFDPDYIARLAASIERVGLLQPVGVRPLGAGRYRLVFGACRVRAFRHLGRQRIPAILTTAEQASLSAQIIENSLRAAHTNTELARAVATLTERGQSNAEIAVDLGLSDPQAVRYYRALQNLPELLVPWADNAAPRALYELANAWRSGTDAQAVIKAELPTPETYLTVNEVRRIVTAATGKAAGGFIYGKPLVTTPDPTASQDAASPDAGKRDTSAGKKSPPRRKLDLPPDADGGWRLTTLAWEPGTPAARLNGDFTADQLRAIADHMSRKRV